MGRTAKYQTADDLLDNTTVRNDCLVWPSANVPIPCIAPASPMAQKFYTNSVARILFTITRYPPGGTRLVRVCSTHFCVNPFHHVEPKIFRLQRQKLLDPHGLLPSQESKRDLIAPPDDYIATLEKSPSRDLDAMLAHARGVQASENFKDDVSVVEVRFRG